MEVLWIKAGDNADFECLPDLKSVAAYLNDVGISPEEIKQRQSGIEAPCYQGDNYIRLFWSDSTELNDSHPHKTKDLSRSAIQTLRLFIEDCMNEELEL